MMSRVTTPSTDRHVASATHSSVIGTEFWGRNAQKSSGAEKTAVPIIDRPALLAVITTRDSASAASNRSGRTRPDVPVDDSVDMAVLPLRRLAQVTLPTRETHQTRKDVDVGLESAGNFLPGQRPIRHGFGHRGGQRDPQPRAVLARLHAGVAAVRGGDSGDDAQPQPAAVGQSGRPGPRRVAAEEPLEHLVPLLGVDDRALVEDVDDPVL